MPPKKRVPTVKLGGMTPAQRRGALATAYKGARADAAKSARASVARARAKAPGPKRDASVRRANARMAVVSGLAKPGQLPSGMKAAAPARARPNPVGRAAQRAAFGTRPRVHVVGGERPKVRVVDVPPKPGPRVRIVDEPGPKVRVVGGEKPRVRVVGGERPRVRVMEGPGTGRRRKTTVLGDPRPEFAGERRPRGKITISRQARRDMRRLDRRFGKPETRARRFGRGVREKAARAMDVVRPVAKEKAGEFAEWGQGAVSDIGGTTIHYGGRVIREGGKAGVSAAGELVLDGINTGVSVGRTVGGKAITTTGEVLTEVGTEVLTGAGEIAKVTGKGAARIATKATTAVVGTAADLAVEGIEKSVELAGKGVRQTVKYGAIGAGKTVAGLTYYLPRAAARRVLRYIGDRRAMRRSVNPNLAGKWKLVLRAEGVPLTNDGFVQHIMQRNVRVKKDRSLLLQVAVEYGFNEKGRMVVRVEPVLVKSPSENALIQRFYAKNFRDVRRGARSLTRRLGGKRGVQDMREQLINAEAFPEEPYAEPASQPVEARGMMPENVAISDAEIDWIWRELQAKRAREGAPAGART